VVIGQKAEVDIGMSERCHYYRYLKPCSRGKGKKRREGWTDDLRSIGPAHVGVGGQGTPDPGAAGGRRPRKGARERNVTRGKIPSGCEAAPCWVVGGLWFWF
jgi:hypothetical protein